MTILKRQNPLFNNKEQSKLKNMVALIAGAGGLGTNQAQQLQRIGIKKIYLYDYDIIAESNLNRQLFYGKDNIGETKVKIAKNHLDNFQLRTKIKTFNKKIKADLPIPEDVNIIFDALDNFSARFSIFKKFWSGSFSMYSSPFFTNFSAANFFAKLKVAILIPPCIYVKALINQFSCLQYFMIRSSF